MEVQGPFERGTFVYIYEVTTEHHRKPMVGVRMPKITLQLPIASSHRAEDAAASWSV